jgi:hypothetical protein
MLNAGNQIHNFIGTVYVPVPLRSVIKYGSDSATAKSYEFYGSGSATVPVTKK